MTASTAIFENHPALESESELNVVRERCLCEVFRSFDCTHKRWIRLTLKQVLHSRKVTVSWHDNVDAIRTFRHVLGKKAEGGSHGSPCRTQLATLCQDTQLPGAEQTTPSRIRNFKNMPVLKPVHYHGILRCQPDLCSLRPGSLESRNSDQPPALHCQDVDSGCTAHASAQNRCQDSQR
jgi:hypothetical protein